MNVFSLSIPFEVIECCHEGCHALFAVPQDVMRRFRETHESFHCPFGHSQSFRAKTDLEIARQELNAANARVQSREDSIRYWRDEFNRQKNRASSLKGQITKLKRKAVR